MLIFAGAVLVDIQMELAQRRTRIYTLQVPKVEKRVR